MTNPATTARRAMATALAATAFRHTADDSFTPSSTTASADWGGAIRWASKEKLRESCAPSAGVFGTIAALIRYPDKLHWFELYPPESYDLRWDVNERSNMAALEPELVAQLGAEIEPLARAAGLIGAPEADGTVDGEIVETLRELG